MSMMSVKVSKRHQIAVPAAARDALNIQSGDRLIVDIQDGMLLLIPQPENYTRGLAGIQHAIWEKVALSDYLEQERQAWESSPKP